MVVSAALVCVPAMAVGGAPAVAAGGASGRCARLVATVPSPRVAHAMLNAVVSVSRRDAWAVGTQNPPFRTLVEHWNGVDWRLVAAPPVPDYTNALSVDSRGEVWMSGQGFVARRSTVGRWRVFRLPGRSAFFSFTGLLAVSPSDVWASAVDGLWHFGDRNGLLHWDGSRWRWVPGVPGLQVADIAAIPGHGLLAVGTTNDGFAGAERWTGTTWRRVEAPNPDASADALSGVAAVSPARAWAVGSQGDGDQDMLPVVDRWDGSRWQSIPTSSFPFPKFAFGPLRHVASASPMDVWAVGLASDIQGDNAIGLLAHYADGRVAFHFDPAAAELRDISIASGTHNGWVVGITPNGEPITQLICG